MRIDARRGFTLTEMLVVLGIILVLMGILIPTIIGVQRQAKRTQCAARLGQIGAVMQMYLDAYDSVLPPGGTANDLHSPGSPVTMTQQKIDVSGGAQAGVVGVSSRVWFEELPPPMRWMGPPGFPASIPPLAYFLRDYLKPSAKTWACPAGSRNDYRASAMAPAGANEAVEGALAGWRTDNVFTPGYRYMGTADFWYGLHCPESPFNNVTPPPFPNRAKVMRWHAFLARNIGGLRADRIRTLRKDLPGQVVVSLDANFAAHTRETASFWGGGTGEWSAHLLYLDGRVEWKTFRNQPEFFELLHGEVPQRWGYVELLERTAMEYPWMAIGTKPVR